MNKTFRILERMWLIGAVVTLGVSAWFFIAGDSTSGIYFLVFAGLCWMMNRVRKKQRKIYDKTGNDKKV